MTKMPMIMISLIGALFLIYVGNSFFFSSYTNFKIVTVAHDKDMPIEGEMHYEECLCAGPLSVMDSYPPIYDCAGIEICRDINKTVGG